MRLSFSLEYSGSWPQRLHGHHGTGRLSSGIPRFLDCDGSKVIAASGEHFSESARSDVQKIVRDFQYRDGAKPIWRGCVSWRDQEH